MSMSCKKRLVLLATGLLFITSSLQSAWGQTATADKVLRWKLKEGQRFDVSVRQDMQQNQVIGGQQIDTTTEMNMQMSWKVLGVDAEGVMSVEQSLDHIALKTSTPMGEIEFDSNSDEQPEGMLATALADSMKPLVGAKFVQRIDPRGKSLGVEVAEGDGNADMVKQLMSNVMLVLPEEGLTKGTTWTDETVAEVPQMGQVTMNRTFEYDGEVQQDGKSLDAVKMTMQTNFGDGEGTAMKIQVEDQSTDGILYFDSEQGYLAGSRITQKMKMTVQAMGQTIQQDQTSTVVTQVTPKG